MNMTPKIAAEYAAKRKAKEAEEMALAEAGLAAAKAEAVKAKAEAAALRAEAKTATKPAKSAPPDPARLRAFVAEIEEALHPHMIAALIDKMQASDGLRLRDWGPHVEVKLAGVTATCTAGGINAMIGWCNAARRKIAELEG